MKSNPDPPKWAVGIRAGRRTRAQRLHLIAASTAAGLAVALLPLKRYGFAARPSQHFPGSKI